MSHDRLDPKRLIAESYRIDGITPPECRSIFFDWALSTDCARGARAALPALLDLYAPTYPDHPMTEVLREGLGREVRTGRRGGRAARVGSASVTR